jgi:hypothetical protein
MRAMMTEFEFDRHYSQLLIWETACADRARLQLIIDRTIRSASLAIAILSAGDTTEMAALIAPAMDRLVQQAHFFNQQGGATLAKGLE